MNYLIIILRATVNLTAAGAFATEGPFSIFDRIRVDLNLGNMNLVDVDGAMLYQQNKTLFRGWGPDGAGNFTPNANIFSAPVAMGDNSWVIPLIIPISANPGSQFDSGLVSLQAPEVQVNVTARLASAMSAFVTNGNTITNATIELHTCYFEYPDPNFVALPPGQVVRTIQQNTPVVQTGQTLYTIDRQGILLQAINRFIANSAVSDAFDSVQLIANINDTIYDMKKSVIKIKNEMDYSSPSQTGVFNIDLWHAIESPSCGDDRDVIDTEVLTTLQESLIVTAGTTLGGVSQFKTLRRILVDFAQPGLGPSV